MTRSCFAALSVSLIFVATGCLDEFTDDRTALRNKPIETPKLPEASVAVAARVDMVGRELVGATPFFPVDPTFHTAAVSEPFVTHPDLKGVIVSEGLVKRCKSDAELASVLAHELGQMAAEKRTADRIRPASYSEVSNDRRPADGPTPDARSTAVELLVAAGYSEKDLDAARPILEEAAANQKVASGIGPRRTVPRWSP
jgi:hypothetical protein